eukprot:6197247-Pleurochrysis_carterae.AAC.1
MLCCTIWTRNAVPSKKPLDETIMTNPAGFPSKTPGFVNSCWGSSGEQDPRRVLFTTAPARPIATHDDKVAYPGGS